MEQLRNDPQSPNMYTLIISILLSLNLISDPQDYYDLSPSQQQELTIVIEDTMI